MEGIARTEKRVTVYLDSGHSGTRISNRVSHTLTDPVDLRDDEGVIVQCVHAQIPNPHVFEVVHGHNRIPYTIRVNGSMVGLSTTATYDWSFGRRRIQWKNGGGQYNTIDTGTGGGYITVPPGKYTPQTLAVKLSDLFTHALRFTVYADHTDTDIVADGAAFYANVLAGKYYGMYPIPMYKTAAQLASMIKQFGKIPVLGMDVRVTFDEVHERLEMKIHPDFRLTGDDTESYFYSTHDITAHDQLIRLEFPNETGMLHVHMTAAAHLNGDLNAEDFQFSHFLGLVAEHNTSAFLKHGVSSSGNLLYRGVPYNQIVHCGTFGMQVVVDPTKSNFGESVVQFRYKRVQNIHVKSNVSTMSVIDSFQKGYTDTLCVLPVDQDAVTTHITLDASHHSLESSLITIPHLNHVVVRLTDEHGEDLHLTSEFTIALQFQYVRIPIALKPLKDLRDRRRFVYAKIKEKKQKNLDKKKKASTIKDGNKITREQSNQVRTRRRKIRQKGPDKRITDG